MPTAHLLRSTLVLSGLLAFACAGEDDLGDAGAGPDPVDAGAPDAGPPDSGVPEGCAPLGAVLQQGTGPTKRGDMAYGYDDRCDRVFMFFGDAAEPQMCNPAPASFLGDGYTFDLRTGQWAEIEVAGGDRPLDRVRPSGAWDTSRERFYVFGGRWRNGTRGAYTYLNDVWAFDPATKTWTELSPQGAQSAPIPRMNTVMVYDEVGDRLLVFAGGRTSGIEFAVDSETWAFDLASNTWSEIAQGGAQPEARLFHMGALDARRNRLWIFGGGGRDSFVSADAFMRDLWYLDLATDTWTQIPAASQCNDDTQCGGGPCVEGLCRTPSKRIKGALVYDEAGDRLVLFAGHDAAQLGNDNDVWTFDIEAGAWIRERVGDEYNRIACARDDDCPGSRTCDIFRGECEQFGFCDFSADFATFDPQSPERRESQLFVAAGDEIIMYGGRTDCGLVNDTWSLDPATATWTELTPAFSGLTCYRSGRQDCDEPDARKCG